MQVVDVGCLLRAAKIDAAQGIVAEVALAELIAGEPRAFCYKSWNYSSTNQAPVAFVDFRAWITYAVVYSLVSQGRFDLLTSPLSLWHGLPWAADLIGGQRIE